MIPPISKPGLLAFKTVLPFTLRYEGGYTNNPKDPGGPTNLGVTIATLSHELRRQATTADVKALTVDKVEPIYYHKYFLASGCAALPNGVSFMAFDIAVNMGVGRAHQFLEATKNMRAKERVLALDRLRMGFWRRLRTWPVFGKGWRERENSCLAEALKRVD